MDIGRYARFERPGHVVTGDRSQRNRQWMSDNAWACTHNRSLRESNAATHQPRSQPPQARYLKKVRAPRPKPPTPVSSP